MARDLIGCKLTTFVNHKVTSGIIVEAEAYTGPDDPAAHGYANHRSSRNDAMFGPPGNTYVYFIYGMHWCFNAVTGAEGFPSAVLIRALEPCEGEAVMAVRRGRSGRKELCSGPAKLCQALGIDDALNARQMPDPNVWIDAREAPEPAIEAGPRVGISKAADWPLRFVEKDSAWISVGKKGARRPPSHSRGE